MVRGKSIGFIKATTSPLTYAHELGHGLGGLKHTFPEVEQGSTHNLMDYANASNLNHKQWSDLRNNLVISWFDDEEDGSYTEDQIISYYQNKEIWRTASENVAYPLIDG